MKQKGRPLLTDVQCKRLSSTGHVSIPGLFKFLPAFYHAILAYIHAAAPYSWQDLSPAVSG